MDSKLLLTKAKFLSSKVKRNVVVWNARKSPNKVRGIPPRKAESLDLNGDPGTPNAAPRAREPNARLYDGSIISTGATDREDELESTALNECATFVGSIGTLVLTLASGDLGVKASETPQKLRKTKEKANFAIVAILFLRWRIVGV